MIATIHDRMRVILRPSAHETWLVLPPLKTAQTLLQPYVAEPTHIYPVRRQVNKPKNDDPSSLEPSS
ncbi:protein of unknown function [Methylocaldum szegediense]|jgi:putative SOS response-associated peptidase YedK|uniref:Uncharacterized protein n=1 Tax=Methylocaldum szegediense TaxID=73780 RepID=A0ABN8XAN8_9GAMM|nr:protein of unknown function [Methylocaldum szegediense]